MTEIRTISGLELREDGRTLQGLVVPYGVDTRIGGYLERFAPGAFADAEVEQVPLLAAHAHADLPIGKAIELVEEARGLVGTFLVADSVKGQEVLALARDGVPLGLSDGFVPTEDRWNAERTHVVRVRARLAEVSVVGVPAYAGARVEAVRALDDQDTSKPLLALARRTR